MMSFMKAHWKAFVIGLAIIIIAIAGWLAYRNYITPSKSALERIESIMEKNNAETVSQLGKMEQEMRAIPAKVKERGDQRVQEIISGSDAAFTDALNEFSKRMVERVDSGNP